MVRFNSSAAAATTTVTVLLSALPSVRALALLPRDDCYDVGVTYEVTSQEQYTRDPYAVGVRCISSETQEPVVITDADALYRGVEVSINGGAGLDIGKVFTAGLSAGFSYSWSTTKGIATSAEVYCPDGQFRCGLSVTEHYVKTKGKRCHSSNDATPFCGGPPTCDDFTVYAPVRSDTISPENQGIRVDFQACLSACQSNDAAGECNDPRLQGVIPCNPGSIPLPP